MNVRDSARDLMLDRDHAEVGFAGGDRGQRILEGRTGQGLRARIRLVDGDMRVRAGLTLEGDGHLCRHACYYACVASVRRAAARSWAVSTPSGTESTLRTSILI